MNSVMFQLLIQGLFHLSVADFMYLELHFSTMNNKAIGLFIYLFLMSVFVCACEIILSPSSCIITTQMNAQQKDMGHAGLGASFPPPCCILHRAAGHL